MDASSDIEAVGEGYSLELMLNVRERTLLAARHIASLIAPGMEESSALVLAEEALLDAGLRQGWHRIVVRFGRNTVKSFYDPSEPDVLLQDTDIFFVDIGPVFGGCEGDLGLTFSVGNDLELDAAAADVVTVWKKVRRAWKEDGIVGSALYELAESIASTMGWRLNLALTGHRLSDFPHKAHYAGRLSEVGFCPASGLWVLEIHIRHPERQFGAFFEDLLVEDDELQRLTFPVGAAQQEDPF